MLSKERFAWVWLTALVVVFVHQPELSLHQRVLPQPDPVFPSPTLSALNTVVLLV